MEDSCWYAHVFESIRCNLTVMETFGSWIVIEWISLHTKINITLFSPIQFLIASQYMYNMWTVNKCPLHIYMWKILYFWLYVYLTFCCFYNGTFIPLEAILIHDCVINTCTSIEVYHVYIQYMHRSTYDCVPGFPRVTNYMLSEIFNTYTVI